MDLVWKAITVFLVGILLLRFSGRKSISQMTIATTVVMISLGTMLVQPVLNTSLWKTILAIFVITVLLVLLEYLQLKFDFLETFFTGKSKILVENGVPHTKNLKKLRVTVDQLESRLRQEGISKISESKQLPWSLTGN